jgi:hypothetical protein
MHVVIPVRVGRNRSLPIALATISRHTDLQPVIVGHNPGVDAPHIPTHQGRDGFVNQETAMHAALDTAWISDPFVWSNDDIYWTRPADPIRWALGLLDDDERTGVHGRRKRDTARLLERHGYPTFDYESHTPLPVLKDPMRDALRMGGTMRSTYGNITGHPDRVAPDVKLRHRHDPIPDTAWLSTAHSILAPTWLTA